VRLKRKKSNFKASYSTEEEYLKRRFRGLPNQARYYITQLVIIKLLNIVLINSNNNRPVNVNS